MELATSQGLRTTARFLECQARILSTTALGKQETALGMTHHPHALLLDRSLDHVVDPVSVYVHDWMHGLFVDGVYNVMVYLLFEEFISRGKKDIYELFGEYISKWRWPGRIANMANVAKIFLGDKKEKHRKAQHIKCQASELMTVSSVLALFVQRVMLPSRVCDDACKAFLALSDVVDFTTCANRGRVSADLLRDAVHKFLSLFVGMWGFEWLTPKFHWLLHYSIVLRKFGMLFNCYVHERFHRVAKRYATDSKNPDKNMANILREVTSHKLGALVGTTAFDFSVGLVKPRLASARVRRTVLELLGAETNLQISTSIESRFSPLGTCIRKDFVLVKSGASFFVGQVQWHIDIGGVPASVISCWRQVAVTKEQGYSEWDADNSLELIETQLILDVVAYTRFANGRVGVLLPCEFR